MKPIRELPCVCSDGALQSCQNTETQHIPLQASTNTLTIENEALNKDGEIGFSYGVYVSTPSHPHFLSSSSKKSQVLLSNNSLLNTHSDRPLALVWCAI